MNERSPWGFTRRTLLPVGPPVNRILFHLLLRTLLLPGSISLRLLNVRAGGTMERFRKLRKGCFIRVRVGEAIQNSFTENAGAGS